MNVIINTHFAVDSGANTVAVLASFESVGLYVDSVVLMDHTPDTLKKVDGAANLAEDNILQVLGVGP